jgi:hypothetical protein
MVQAALDFCRLLHGVPGKVGCCVVFYVCNHCFCIPVTDLHWSITKGHGQGSGWWCTKCGKMWDGYSMNSFLLGIQQTVSWNSMLYFRTSPPPQECLSFIEVRKFATNALNANLNFTASATVAEFAQQPIDFVRKDNHLAAIAAKDLAATVVVARTVGPARDMQKYLPNYKLVQDQFTLMQKDWNREERYCDLNQLPAVKEDYIMPEKEWAPLCNMIYSVLTIAEATGAGTLEEKKNGPMGKGRKQELAKNMTTAITIKETGRYPMNHWKKGRKVSEEDKKWAAEWKPCEEKEDKKAKK